MQLERRNMAKNRCHPCTNYTFRHCNKFQICPGEYPRDIAWEDYFLSSRESGLDNRTLQTPFQQPQTQAQAGG
jgi:hypothetical protein